MFKISFIVDDKRLPDMLRASSGHVYNLEVVPVANAEPVPVKATKTKLLPAPKKVQEASTGPRNFIQELGWEKGRQFRAGAVIKRCSSLGMKESSHWYVITTELKAVRIKKIGVGLYEVL